MTGTVLADVIAGRQEARPAGSDSWWDGLSGPAYLAAVPRLIAW